MPLEPAVAADDAPDLPHTGQQRSNIVRQKRAYAALDLGTNNCRLLIARPTRGGFYVVDAYSRIVRLGEGMLQSGRLSNEAIDRAIHALKGCAEKLRRRNVWISRNVATEACRRAANGDEFVDRVYAESGIALDVITPEEEARLAVLGCETLIDHTATNALVFDIGGGSTEIVLVDIGARRGTNIRGWTSVPWGVVSLTETEPVGLATPEARIEAFLRMRARVVEKLEEVRASLTPEGGFQSLQLLGTSGTITTLASLHMGLGHYDRNKIDGAFVNSQAIRDLAANLSAMDHDSRARQSCIGEERADLIVAGCAILDAILEMFPAEQVRVADRGIREGILRTLMRRDGYQL